jgi:O-6-methylguanine DNA methyltransferase
MRFISVSSASLRGCRVRIGRRAGFTQAVAEMGDLILQTPASAAAARNRLLRWGVTIVPGPLPIHRRTVAAGTDFQFRVWQATRGIPSGQTRTYGELAQRIGCESAQAVGGALGANPLAILIPCHRIVSASGLGGFAWGLRRKQAWLAAERRGVA